MSYNKYSPRNILTLGFMSCCLFVFGNTNTANITLNKVSTELDSYSSQENGAGIRLNLVGGDSENLDLENPLGIMVVIGLIDPTTPNIPLLSSLELTLHLLGANILGTDKFNIADANADGEINMADVIFISNREQQRFLNHLEEQKLKIENQDK